MVWITQTFTRRQWLTLFVFAVADFCSAICVSLQAPFYPAEAERKGATATEYGLVFGVFELTVFIVSPIMGRNLGRFGAKRVFNVGILTTGSCSILFGFLDRIENGNTFIGLSVVVRALEAVGNSGFLTASFSIIAKEFPENVATMFACLETFFGIGLIVGPSVGGALYQVGGFTLPFVALGGLLICAAIMTHFVLPSKYDERSAENELGKKKGMIDALKIPSIALAAYSILCASITIGYIQATLEPHLRQFNLTPVMMGVMFMVNGGVYALAAPMWGFLCDKKLAPNIVTAIGSLLITISFLFIGPAPFIPLPTLLLLCVAMLIVHGIGFAAELVAGFATAHREAVETIGFGDNLNTYAVVSSLWTATFALGAFIGPTVGGLLVDYFHFRSATLFVVATQLSVLVLSLAFIERSRRIKNRQLAYQTLESENQDLSGGHHSSRSPSLAYDSLSNSISSPVITEIGGASPDSGSFTDHSVIDIAERLRQQEKLRRPRSSRTRNRLTVPNPRGASSSLNGTDAVFSPLTSPLEPSPVSLLGGFLGISVPTTMNHIFEEPEFDDHLPPVRGTSRRQRSLTSPSNNSEREPLIPKNRNQARIVVTAIVEDSQCRMKHPSGQIA